MAREFASNMKKIFKKEINNYTLYGVLFGVLFPLTATILECMNVHGSLTFANIAAVQSANPLLWIIDSAPFWLGLFARIGGAKQDRLMTRTQATLADKEKIVEEITHQKDLILNSAGEGIFGLDGGGNMTFVNPAAEKMLGFPPDELIGKPCHDLIHHSYPDGTSYPRERCYISATFHEGSSCMESNEVFWRKDGTCFPAEYVTTPIRQNGKLSGAVVVFKDISRRKKAEKDLIEAKEEAEKASRAKSLFLARMSHELRTPMNAILGFGQILEMEMDGSLTPNQKENVSRILEAGEHLLALINEVLDLSRVESGNLDLHLDDVDARSIIDELVPMVQPLADELKVKIFTPGEREVYVKADTLRLKQVLINLVSNGIKFNRPGGSVTLEFERPQPGRLGIRVSDTGKGIPAEDRLKIFQPFNRLEMEGGSIEGLGIGLNITKNLVELMQGRIEVESTPGKGTCFKIIFREGEKPETRLGPGKREFFSSTGPEKDRKFTLLYIEDNPANIELVRQTLERRTDVKLVSAPDAKTGLKIARKQHPQLILMDIHLPGMSGLEAFQELKKHKVTQSIPVIVLSADAMSQDIQRAIDMGFHSYLTKPLDLALLLKTVDGFIQQHDS